MNKLIFKLSIFLIVCQGSSYAQDTLNSMIIITTGEYKPVITDANKINNHPEIIDSTKKIPVKGYSISPKKVNTGFDVDPIVPAQMVGEPLTKLYNALVKIGMGTYTTPYGELWYNNLRSKEYAAGLRMKHLSSSATLKDHGFAGFSDNEISLYGKKFLKEHSLIGNFDYARNVVHFYGYDANLHTLNKGATEQRFNLFSANTELMSHYTKEERLNHDIKLSYYNFSDYYKAAENNIRANGMVQTTISKELFRVNASVDYYNYRTTEDTVHNTIITLNPNFIATGEKYRASLGVTAAMDIFVRSRFYFYPNVDLSYNVFENIIIPYVGATGGLQKNSFRSVAAENPFILSELALDNTNKKYELYGGIRGTLSSTLAFNARASYSSIDRLLLFVNDTKDLLQNRFDVIYDDAELLNIRGEISYQNREKLRISLKGEYFNYKMENELRAWYKPQVEITLSANYNLRDKIVVKADLFYVDVQYARIFEADPTALTGTKVAAMELKGVFDANLGVEYRYNKKLGFFVNLNNIAGVRYNRWMNYPTQRFSVMGGLSYSF